MHYLEHLGICSPFRNASPQVLCERVNVEYLQLATFSGNHVEMERNHVKGDLHGMNYSTLSYPAQTASRCPRIAPPFPRFHPLPPGP